MNEKKVYYPINTKFKIIPNPDIYFENYLDNLKREHGLSLFWAYNKSNHCLVVNENTMVTESDIFYQFNAIAFWLFSRGYTLDGSFYYRIQNMIGYIQTFKNDKNILHYTIFDESNSQTEEELWRETKKKIDHYMIEKNTYQEEILDLVKKKLIKIEKDMNKLSKISYFIIKLCAIIGVLSVGIIVLC